MFTRLVVATDLSPASDAMLDCLPGLKALGAQEVVLVHALGLRHLHSLREAWVRAAEPKLAQQKALLESQGFQTSVEIPTGFAEYEVNRVARERQASLLVVGSHGSTCLQEALLGGTALSILHQARTPTLIVRLAVKGTEAELKCELACDEFRHHVLYPTDFSDVAERAFGYVEKIVDSGARRITLAHVQDRVRIERHLKHRLEEFNQIDRGRLERLRDRLTARGAEEVRLELPYGVPVQELLRIIEREEISWVVMGSQGRGFIAEVFLGSVAHQIARLAPVPVLLVPSLR